MTPDAPDVAEMIRWLERRAEMHDDMAAARNAANMLADMADLPDYEREARRMDAESEEAEAAMLRAIAERLRARGGT